MGNQFSQPALRRVYLLGNLQIETPQGSFSPAGSRVRCLLAFLLLHPDVLHTRDYLADRLYPDAPAERVRRYLSDTLYRLRQALDDDWLLVESQRVGLRDVSTLWVDAWEFERLCASGDLADLQQAAALYKGDLLPEIYDDWILVRRVSLHEQYLTCLLRLGEAAEQRNQPEVAFEYYHRLVHADPLREDAQRGLMRSLARTGRLADALEVYARLERTLDAELGLQPVAETRALADQLRSALDLARQTTAHRRAGLMRPPFVGRVAERMHLLVRLDQARAGRGGITTVLGAAGIGKTRLLEEFASAATWRGWQVAWGRSQELSLPLPNAPLHHALASALIGPRLQQLARLVPPRWLALLARLFPEIDALPELSATELPDEPLDQRQITLALGRLLAGLQQIGPHLLILEDVQWADPAIWPLLDELRESLAEMQVLVVLSARDDELRALDAAWSLVESWDRAGERLLLLGGLSSDELAVLADLSGWCDPSPDALEQLRNASGGNPLLALTLLQADDMQELSALPSLTGLTLRRLALLSAAARRALQGAAVLGYRFDYALWEALVAREAIPVEQLPHLAGELEQQGLILLEQSGYHFAHDTLRAAVYADLPASTRRRWHQHALDVLQAHGLDEPLTLLSHAERAGVRPAVAVYALQAGARALKAFSLRAAVRYFSQALGALPAADLRGRYMGLLGRARAYEMLAERVAQGADLAVLHELAQQLGDAGLQVEVAQDQARYLHLIGKLDQAQARAEHGLELARRLGDRAKQAALLETLGRIARDQGDYARSQAQIMQAREIYRALGSLYGEASTTNTLGSLAWTLGDYQTAVAQHAAAADLFHQIGDILQEASALNNLGSAFWGLGDYAGARATHERALAVCRELGDKRGEGDNLDNLGGVAWILGDYPTAIDYYSRALTIRRATNDTWGISISLGNLGSAYRLVGDFDTALAYYAEALQVNRAMGRQRGEGFVQHGRGLALLEAGKLAEARAALDAAYAIRVELGERDNLVETSAALALLCCTEADLPQAQRYLQEALDALDHQRDRAPLRQWVSYVAARVCEAQGQRAAAAQHLRLAQAAMLEIANSLPPDARERFLCQVPLNQQTTAALATFVTQVQVSLARAAAPLGRKLDAADYVSVTWTVYAPEDDLFPKPDERRRHVLRRLLEEAAAQGAAPTDDDLAAALGVSRRTILRDMERLVDSGVASPTRRRRA